MLQNWGLKTTWATAILSICYLPGFGRKPPSPAGATRFTTRLSR